MKDGGRRLREGCGGLPEKHMLLMLLKSLLVEAIFKEIVHKKDGFNADLFFPLEIVLGVAVCIGQVFAHALMKLKQLPLIDYPIFLHKDHHTLRSVDEGQALLVHAHNIWHE